MSSLRGVSKFDLVKIIRDSHRSVEFCFSRSPPRFRITLGGHMDHDQLFGVRDAGAAGTEVEDVHEVVLQINLEAKAGDKVVWLLELQQAGAFMIRNLSASDVGQVLSIMAPNYLLAFARATVSETVVKGGFPPFLLPLVTFEGLHARAAQQAATQSAPAAVN